MAENVIIGNGVAGIKAAEIIRKYDGNCKITVIGEEDYPFYYRPQLPGFVSGKIDENKLWGKKQDFCEKKNIDFRLGEKVDKVNPVNKEIILRDRISL
jgi:nitrite reductase (NADH) large subunit